MHHTTVRIIYSFWKWDLQKGSAQINFCEEFVPFIEEIVVNKHFSKHHSKSKPPKCPNVTNKSIFIENPNKK